TVWFDVERNRGHWRPGLFMGYAKRGYIVEPTEDLPPFDIFGRGAELAYFWRIQPRLTYTTLKGLSFVGEAEYTYAGYEEPVGNLRLSLSAVYSF
ncbi:MAG: hypothetical protein J5641_06515, partial [Bacteroidales bacterium]|nr:hypothetical protein [Bacteroidales bacterium]